MLSSDSQLVGIALNDTPMSKFILLAEDDEDDQLLFRNALGTVCAPCTLDVAPDGLAALTKLEEGQPVPDVVVLDINMPQMNGIQCLEAIREQERFKSLKVVMFSTAKDPALINRTRELGANLFFTKPDSYKGLRKIVEEILAA